jgi:formylglycine-generating enzyme required for sulfatase activity
VYRGGSWFSFAYGSRVAGRNDYYPTGTDYGIGFRVLRSLAP